MSDNWYLEALGSIQSVPKMFPKVFPLFIFKYSLNAIYVTIKKNIYLRMDELNDE